MEELDLTKTIEFEVLGDIKPTIIEILGSYETWMSSDCDLHLKGTLISLPAYCKWLTYYGSFHDIRDMSTEQRIIKALYEKGLIKVHYVRPE